MINILFTLFNSFKIHDSNNVYKNDPVFYLKLINIHSFYDLTSKVKACSQYSSIYY